MKSAGRQFLRLGMLSKWAFASTIAVIAFYTIFILFAVVSLVLPLVLAYWVWTYYPSLLVNVGVGLGAIISTIWLSVVHIRASVFASKDVDQGKSPSDLGIPRLTTLVEEVEDALLSAGYSVRRFDSVEVTTDASAMTTVRWRCRRLILGWGLVRALGENELKSVIAHEFAHHLNGSMSFVWSVHRISTSIGRWRAHFWQSLRHVYVRGRESMLGRCYHFTIIFGFAAASLMYLLFWIMEFFLVRYVRVRSHEFEFECDRIADRVIGGGAMSGALYRVCRVGICWPHALLKWNGDDGFWKLLDLMIENDVQAREDFKSLRERDSSTHPSLDARLECLQANKNLNLEKELFLTPILRASIDNVLEAPVRTASKELRAFSARIEPVANAVDELRGLGRDADGRAALVVHACATILEVEAETEMMRFEKSDSVAQVGWERGRKTIYQCLVPREEGMQSQDSKIVHLHPPDRRLHDLVACAIGSVERWMEARAHKNGSAWLDLRRRVEGERLGIDATTPLSELRKRLGNACGAMGFIVPDPYAYACVEGRTSLFTFE